MTLNEFFAYELVHIQEYVLTVGSIFSMLMIMLATAIFLRVVKNVIYKRWRSNKQDGGKKHSIYTIIKYVAWVIAICLMLDEVGINVTILVASSAALFIGIGLGLQEMFKDLTSGIMLLFEGTIEVGDVVEVDGLVGRVVEIGLRTSKVITRDEIVMIIPNHKFISERVINWSHNFNKTRFHVAVGVSYGSDTELVREALLECCHDMSQIFQDPKPFVRFTDFGESSLDFQLYFWSEYVFEIENIKSELRFRINKKFREKGIEIPFPQRDLHLKSGFNQD